MRIRELEIRDIEIGDLVKLREKAHYYNKGIKYSGYRKVKGIKEGLRAFTVEGDSYFGYYYTPEMVEEVRRPVKYETIYKYKESILDEKEKEYLRAVIRPFRDRIVYITKYEYENYDEQYILIRFDEGGVFILPDFKKGTMYKGMELDRKYTIEELGL